MDVKKVVRLAEEAGEAERDLKAAKREYEHMRSLEEEVTKTAAETVKKAIDVCRDGGLILGSSGEIHPEVKPKNAIALFRTAKSYRRR